MAASPGRTTVVLARRGVLTQRPKVVDAWYYMKRRHVIRCAGCICASLSLGPVGAQPQGARIGVSGCFFSQKTDAARGIVLKEGIYRRTTGDDGLNAKVNAILFRTARAYGLDRDAYPAFRFLPPGADGGDGFASDAVEMQPGTKGIVALNLGLLTTSQSEELSLIGFEVIAGHEFGHIFQMRKNYAEPLLVAGDGKAKLVELHADFLAGWFMSKRGQIPNEILRHVVDALFSRGDDSVGTPEHHGTKAERFTAVLQGYLRGGTTDSADGAAANGVAYLKEIT